jgi:hypothetical protein
MRKLKATGFLVNYGRGGRGLMFAILERLGGTHSHSPGMLFGDTELQGI